MSSPASKFRNLSLPPQSTFRWIGDLGTMRARIFEDTRGEMSNVGSPFVSVLIHMGAPTLVGCRRGDEEYSGIARHGDIDIIPTNTDCSWQVDDLEAVLSIGIHPDLLTSVAEESGRNPDQLLISNRFQIKDLQLENLCWAVRHEMEAGYPTGKIYIDSLATAFAARLVHQHSSLARASDSSRKLGKISPAKLRQILAFIEDRLGENLSLADIAAHCGMSASHFKAVFRESMGQPVHRYLVQRRVERAAWLLRNRQTPIAEIALQTGFAHQSHLALQMRRILGQSPRDLRKNLQ